MYHVQTLGPTGRWGYRTSRTSYRDAVEIAHQVGGRVVCRSGIADQIVWELARSHDGFMGDYAAWQAQDDCDRDAFVNLVPDIAPPVVGLHRPGA